MSALLWAVSCFGHSCGRVNRHHNRAVAERISFTAGYMHESYYRKMESRSRPVINGVGADFSDFDWISNITDTPSTPCTAG